MGEDERRSSSNILEESGRAVDAAKNVVKLYDKYAKASTAAKAGAAAAGSSAAVPIAIAVVVLLLVLAIVGVLHAIPSPVYEASEAIDEMWAEVIYMDEDNGNQFFNVIRFVGRLVESIFATITETANNLWQSAVDSAKTQTGDTEKYLSGTIEGALLEAEDELRLTIVKKITATNKKYKTRANNVSDAIKKAFQNEENKNAVINYLSAINGIGTTHGIFASSDPSVSFSVEVHVNELGLDNDASTTADTADAVVDGLYSRRNNHEEFMDYLTTNVSSSGGNLTSLAIMALASVQTGGDIRDVKLSDYMRYLGYKDPSSPPTTKFDIVQVGGTPIVGEVEAWKGSFKPQYLYEEMKYYKGQLMLAKLYEDDSGKIDELNDIVNDYDNYGMPFIDLLVKVNFPEINSVYSVEKLKEYYGENQPTPTVKSFNGSTFVFTTYTRKSGEHYGVVCTTTAERTEFHGIEIDIPRSINYTIYCEVVPRNLSEIIPQIGLWSGSLSEDGTSYFINENEYSATEPAEPTAPAA